MSTKAELIARISAEARIVSETLITDYDQIRTYVIRHERTRNVNVEGRQVTLWVYDEGGAGEEALMDYDQWLDVPLSVRLSDYIDTLPTTISVRNIGYMTAYIVRFTEVTNTGIKTEKIGIWNYLTDKLDVYESTDNPIPGVKPILPNGYYCFGEGYRTTKILINPADGKANAIKVPLFEVKSYEQPQGIGFIDEVNQQIKIIEGFELLRIDLAIEMILTGATQGEGTIFYNQWQQNGVWIGIERNSGYLKGDVTYNLTVMGHFEDIVSGGDTYYDLWLWTEGRQGTIEVGDVSCIVTEVFYDPLLRYL